MDDAAVIETRKARLLSAAPALAESVKLDQLTATGICAAAKLPERDFAAEFDSVESYVAELHRKFLDGLLARMIRETGDLKPGIERILKASFAQLNGCLEQRQLRAWFADARRKMPRIAEDIHQRNRGTSMMISIELGTLGCRRPMIIARLYCQMMLEAAQMEADAGGAIPELRQALRDVLTMWLPARSPVAA